MLYKLLSYQATHRMSTSEISGVISLADAGIYGPRLKSLGVPVYCLNMQHDALKIKSLIKLYYILKAQKPDILQTWLYHADLLGLVFGRIAGIPKIIWNLRCSDMDFTLYSHITRRIFALNARLSSLPDAVIANSESGQKFHLQAGYNPRQWKHIPNGFDTEQYKPDKISRIKGRQHIGISKDAPVIGMIARYDPMKDYTNFFTAAEIAASIFSDICFILVGRGVNEQNNCLGEMARQKGLNGKIYLLGERRDIDKIIPMFDIGTLSSSFGEGFPNVLGEMMACEVPCVATDVGDTAYLIENTGIIVPPRNSELLARAWLELLSMSPEKRAELGAKARKRIEENFSISYIVQQYESFYFNRK